MNDSDKLLDRFLHATDLHFWRMEWNPLRLLNKRVIGNANVALRRRKEFRTDRAEGVAQRLASLGVPDIVLGGDFTSTALDAEFAEAERFVQQLHDAGMRPIAIPGNHDVYTFESVRRARFHHYLGKWTPGPDLPCVHSLPGGTPVLCVPTVCPNLLSSAGSISDDEVAAARDLLNGLQPPVVVVGHYPLLHETAVYRVGRSRRLRNAEALRRMFGQSDKRILYVSGHVHRFNYQRDPHYSSLEHLTSGALFRHDPASGAVGDFSEVHVTPKGFRVYRHRLLQEWDRSETALS